MGGGTADTCTEMGEKNGNIYQAGDIPVDAGHTGVVKCEILLMFPEYTRRGGRVYWGRGSWGRLYKCMDEGQAERGCVRPAVSGAVFGK